MDTECFLLQIKMVYLRELSSKVRIHIAETCHFNILEADILEFVELVIKRQSLMTNI